MKEKVSYMLIFIILLGSVFTGLMIVVDCYTKPVIEKNERVAVKKSILNVLDIEYDEDSVEEVFLRSIETKEIDGKKFYLARGGLVVFRFQGPGLWGPIAGVISISPDLETISGINIIYHEETPGLGGRIEEDEFLSRFKGKKLIPRLEIVAPGKSKTENEVDGITAATLTSKAFGEILNNIVLENILIYKKR